MLSDTISNICDRFAIHGFITDGRPGVEYNRYKYFEQSNTEVPRATWRLYRVLVGSGTATILPKLLLVITDGSPRLEVC